MLFTVIDPQIFNVVVAPLVNNTLTMHTRQ